MADKLLHRDSSVYSKDLTSSQIWDVLNNLLFSAIGPSIEYSNLAFEVGLSCACITSNAKRKLSGLEPEEFLQVCFTQLVITSLDPTAENKVNMIKTFQDKGLERNVLYEYAQKCLVVLPPLNIPNVDVTKHWQHIDLYLKLYDKFRQDVMERFRSLTEFSARRNYHSKIQSGLSAEEYEHYHVFTLSLMRAIDKFVPWRGTLASYILSWFENAKGASQYMVYGDEVFGLTRAIRKQVHDGSANIRNKVVPLSDRENTIPDDVGDLSVDLIIKTARLPQATLIFFANGLPYYPKKEIAH